MVLKDSNRKSPMKISHASTILVAACAIVFCLTTCEGRTHVTITNKLTTKSDVTVHCKSKDDDLGNYLLAPGVSYSFSFKHDFFGRTLFFCSAKWKGNFHYFDAYKSSYDCSECNWEIRDKAACRIVNTPAGICTNWN